jgi:hypothetical protein
MLICATWDLEVLGRMCVFRVLDVGTTRSYVELSVQLDLLIAGIRLTALFLILLFSLFIERKSHRNIVIPRGLGRRNRRGQVIIDFRERSETVTGNTWLKRPREDITPGKNQDTEPDISWTNLLGSVDSETI